MPIEILMPTLSPTMSKTGGKIVKWRKKEQDRVEVGDVIAEIETDKAVMEFESIDEGTLAKILVPEGTSDIPVNQLIAVILKEGEDESALNNYTLTEDKFERRINETIENVVNGQNVHQGLNKNCIVESLETSQRLIFKSEKGELMSSDEMSESCRRTKVSPIARRIAEDASIDIKQLRGTGPYGRIIKDDVLNFLGNVENHKKSQQDIELKVSNMRQVIAQRLVESKQNIPHFYLTVDCYVNKLISLKNEINLVNENNKVTINDLVIKAVALSIRKFPEINSSWMNTKIVRYSNIDISIAVALKDGLITPIVKSADEKSVLSISKEVKNLVVRARSGKLKPEEFQGGGFTVSNLGIFSIKAFSAIINPPQSCIMAIGSSQKQPAVIDEKIEIVEAMTVTLSADHRTVDGVLGAKFLNTFKYYIENPIAMLL